MPNTEKRIVYVLICNNFFDFAKKHCKKVVMENQGRESQIRRGNLCGR